MILENPRHETFAQRIAAGASTADAYVAAGYSAKAKQQSGSRLLNDKRIRGRVNELRARISEKLQDASIREIDKRVTALQDRWDRMKRIIEARAADPSMQKVPGGDTGLLVRKIKSSGGAYVAKTETEGEGGEISSVGLIEEYAVDTGLLREMREHELQAAKELGQLTQKLDVTATVNLVERLNAGRQRLLQVEKEVEAKVG
jgi:hypothetical protein